MNGRGIVWIFLIVSLISLGTVFTDGSDGLPGDTFTVDGIDYAILDENHVRATCANSTVGSFISLPSQVPHDGHTYIVTSIGMEFSMYVDIESISIPETVIEIVPGALSSSTLDTITVHASNPVFRVEGNVLYDDVRKAIVRYCPSNVGAVFEVPSDILTLDAYSFYYASNLEEIRGIPNFMSVIGDYTFHGCSSLIKVNYDVVRGANILPEGLLFIGNSAFSLCDLLGNVVLPESLVFLDSYAFAYNDTLRTIDIPENVNYIGDSAFFSCRALESITVSAANPNYTSLDGVLFLKEGNPTTLDLIHYPSMKPGASYVLPELSNKINREAFYGAVHLKSVVFNDNFTVIPAGALFGAYAVETVTLPSTTIFIDMSAFSDCTALKTIIGGESVVTIGAWAFSGTNLSHPFIPKSLTAINDYAFSGCMGFVDITIPSNVKRMGSYIFENCSNIVSITFEGTNIDFASDSLSMGSEESPMDVSVYYHKGLTIPSDVSNQFTVLDLIELGKDPYPWENLIGVAVCLLILFGMFRLFKEV